MIPGFLLLAGFYPLIVAIRRSWESTFFHPLLWWFLGWTWWMVIAFNGTTPEGRYFGLALVGCGGIAVLGARRPGVYAWHFVVVGLLATLSLPLILGLGKLRLSTESVTFLAATLIVSVTNYFPTRFRVAALLVGVWATLELLSLVDTFETSERLRGVMLAMIPWSAWLAGRRFQEETAKVTMWLDFRDRFGFLWGQRMEDQFNRAAENKQLGIELTWEGFVETSEKSDRDQAEKLLKALLQRFSTTPVRESAEKG